MAAGNLAHCELMSHEVIAAFLSAAAELYGVALDFHQDVHASSLEDGLHAASSRVEQTINELLTAENRGTALSIACCMVAKDLKVKVQQLHNSRPEADHALLNAIEFRAVWPMAAVQALGNRLHDLIEQWSEVHPDSK